MENPMERKIAQTELDPQEYSTLAEIARKKGLSIKEALRQAAAKWVLEESGINPEDPIFDIAMGRRRAWSPTGKLSAKSLRNIRKASEEVDKTVYK